VFYPDRRGEPHEGGVDRADDAGDGGAALVHRARVAHVDAQHDRGLRQQALGGPYGDKEIICGDLNTDRQTDARLLGLEDAVDAAQLHVDLEGDVAQRVGAGLAQRLVDDALGHQAHVDLGHALHVGCKT